MGHLLDFKRPDNTNCRGYLATAGQDRPGVVVIQEWWGLNDQICGVADRFARAGFNALAPDLYHGRITQDADEASHMMNGLDFPGATHQDIHGAVTHLQRISSQVGAMGFCMGGALTIAAAVHVPALSVAACFYGIPPQEFADPANIRIPFQGHFANQDDWCVPSMVDALEATLQKTGAPAEIHRYDAAHGFFNERRADVYDANAASLAWDRMMTFFAHHLG